MHKENYRGLLVDIRKHFKEHYTIEDSLLAEETAAAFFSAQAPSLARDPLASSPSKPKQQPAASFTKENEPPLHRELGKEAEKKFSPKGSSQALESVASEDRKSAPNKDAPSGLAINKAPHLESLKQTPIIENNEEWKALCKKVAPNWKLTDNTPSDEEAKRIAERWKDPLSLAIIAVLFFDEKEKDLIFLKNLVLAIQNRLASCDLINGKKIEEEKKWDLFLKDSPRKLILASSSLQKASDMKRHYKELPATAESLLGSDPILFLPPLSTYYKDPLQKRALWKTLCQRLEN